MRAPAGMVPVRMRSRITSAACSAACRMGPLSRLHAILLRRQRSRKDLPSEIALKCLSLPLDIGAVTRGSISCMQSVQIVEVSPRDGLQNEQAILATSAKAELIAML